MESTGKFQKLINSCAIYRNSQSCLKERVLYSQTSGIIDVGLHSENHHKISLIIGEDILLNEGVVPLLRITSYTALFKGADI